MTLQRFKGAMKLWAKVILVSASKIGESTTNILKLLFFTIDLHFVKLKQISTYRKLNLTLTSSIHFVFLPLEMKKMAATDQSKALVFLLCLKVASAKTFSPVYMLLVHLALMNVFYSMWYMEDLKFCESLSLLLDFWSAMLLLSLKPVFWKSSVFYLLSLQSEYDANTKVPKYSWLSFLIFLTNFTFVTVPDFS